MINDVALALGAAAGLVLAVAAPAFSNPGGLLALCVTRRQRWRYRKSRLESASKLWHKTRAQQRSSRISKHLRTMVLRADRHRCVVPRCASRTGLQVDHIVPWSLGGLTALFNCAATCKSHNLAKSNYWKASSGRVYYRAWRGHDDVPLAALILAAELAARRSPARWLRAFGLLPSW